MAINPNSNAITHRLELLRQHYETFKKNKNAILYHWQSEPSEYRMIDAFYYVESSNEAVFEDIFLPFASPFKDPFQYTQALLEEFAYILEKGQIQLTEKNIQIPFRLPLRLQDTKPLFQYFKQFVDCFPDLRGNFVLYLKPSKIEDLKAWEEWLIQVLKYDLFSKIRLMIARAPEESTLSKLKEVFPKKIMSISPELDMEGAMQQMSSAGQPQDPGVQFRKAFVEMGIAARKGNLQKARKWGDRALNIAQQQVGWEQMETGIYTALASYLMEKKSTREEAIQLYQKAYLTAKRAHAVDLPGSLALLTQTLFFKGAAYIQIKKYQAASECYDAIPELIKGDKNSAFQQMEAFRMAGFCYRMKKDISLTWARYWSAFEMAKELDEQTRKQSTLPYIGQGLLEVMIPSNNYDKESYIRRKLVEYVGEDWETKLQSK